MSRSGGVYMKPPRRPVTGIMGTFIVVWSILSFLIGISLIGSGAYTYFNPDMFYPYLDVIRDILLDARITIIAIGTAVGILSVFSVLGVCSRKKIFLQVYCYIVILLLLAQFAFALFFFINKQNLLGLAENECMTRLSLYSNSPLYTDLFNTLQSRLQCCGCSAASDYMKATILVLPASCYDNATKVLNSEGCLAALYQIIDDKSVYMIIYETVTAVTLLLAIVLTNCYIIRHRYQGLTGNRVTPTPSLSRSHRVTPSPSLTSSLSHLDNNWVNNNKRPLIVEDTF